jgi:hypothetical protein
MKQPNFYLDMLLILHSLHRNANRTAMAGLIFDTYNYYIPNQFRNKGIFRGSDRVP